MSLRALLGCLLSPITNDCFFFLCIRNVHVQYFLFIQIWIMLACNDGGLQRRGNHFRPWCSQSPQRNRDVVFDVHLLSGSAGQTVFAHSSPQARQHRGRWTAAYRYLHCRPHKAVTLSNYCSFLPNMFVLLTQPYICDNWSLFIQTWRKNQKMWGKLSPDTWEILSKQCRKVVSERRCPSLHSSNVCKICSLTRMLFFCTNNLSNTLAKTLPTVYCVCWFLIPHVWYVVCEGNIALLICSICKWIFKETSMATGIVYL